MENIVSTCDLYEACYYSVNSCVLENIQVFQVGKKMVCEMSYKGTDIYELRDLCLRGTAEINLMTFKTAYSKLLQQTYHAKKKFYNDLKGGKDD